MATNREMIRKNIMNASQNYNKCIADLLNCVKIKSKNDDEMVALCEKFAVVKSVDGDIITQASGPYIWKYRKEIRDKDEQFFIKNNFTAEVEQVKTQKKDDIGGMDIYKIIKMCKQLWASMSVYEKEICWNHLQGCVRNYASYIGCSKQLKN